MNELLDNRITIENSFLEQKAIDVLQENDIFSVSELLEELSKNGVSLNAGFVEEALCLEKGTLSVERSDRIQPLEVVLKKK